VDVPSQPGDLAFVMRRVATLDGDDSDLAAAANTKLQGIMGLSLGGLTVLLATYHPTLHIQGIDAAVAQAPKSCFLGQSVFVRPLPTLILTGTADEPVPPEGPERVFSMAPPPVMLVELLGGTHTGFMNREQPLVANTDTRECELLVAAESSQAGADFGEALRQGAWPDAYSPNACPPTCSQRLVQTMGATRQLQLARAATLAHFEATLRGRQDAAAFLTARLDQLPDVQVQSKR
jgi:dienelactone hydrolase